MNSTRGIHPIWNMPHSNMHDFQFISNSNVTDFEALFWPFLTFSPISTCIDIVHTGSFLEWCSKPETIPKEIVHPISNVLDTIMHMFEIHVSAFTHCFNDCFGHCLALFDPCLRHGDQINISMYQMPLFGGCRLR